MEGRKEEKVFVPPHTSFSALPDRYVDTVMRYTYKNPDVMGKAPYVTGALSAALIPSFFIARIPRPIGAFLSLAGITGMTLSFATAIFQQRVFGLPVDNKPMYEEANYTFQTACGEIIIDRDYLPRLNIKSLKPYDAGFVEGYLLGEAIKINLDALKPLFDLLKIVAGNPNERKFKLYFSDFLDVIPKDYIDEMEGKVKGYNTWLKEHYPIAEPLTFYEYIFIQSIPGYRNYLPVQNCPFVSLFQSMCCTTFALRFGDPTQDITIIARILDFAFCGNVNSVIEINRKIAGKKGISDVAHPLISGALTVVNENGVLLELNVAPGKKVIIPEGEPDIFLIRHLAERADSVDHVSQLIDEEKTLGSFHLTASDGRRTTTTHFLQDLKDPSKHVIEELHKADPGNPHVLVIANSGIEEKGNHVVPFNFRNSEERKENLYQFFKQPRVREELQKYGSKPDNVISQDTALIKTLLEAASLPLVCNAASAQLIFYQFVNETISAIATLNNTYAPMNKPGEFKRLRLQ